MTQAAVGEFVGAVRPCLLGGGPARQGWLLDEICAATDRHPPRSDDGAARV